MPGVRGKNMSRAQIVNGVWVRNIPRKWQQPGGMDRADIFKSVLADSRLKVAEYRFIGGPVVRIPKEELQRVVAGWVDHCGDKSWGPFNINYQDRTVNGLPVDMEVL
jgi:hypothetical protein